MRSNTNILLALTAVVLASACGGSSTEVRVDAPASTTANQVAEGFCGLYSRCGQLMGIECSSGGGASQCTIDRRTPDYEQCTRNYALEVEQELKARPLTQCEADWMTVCLQDLESTSCLSDEEITTRAERGESVDDEPESCRRLDDCDAR